MSTTRGIPWRSPMQVLTTRDRADGREPVLPLCYGRRQEKGLNFSDLDRRVESSYKRRIFRVLASQSDCTIPCPLSESVLRKAIPVVLLFTSQLNNKVP